MLAFRSNRSLSLATASCQANCHHFELCPSARVELGRVPHSELDTFLLVRMHLYTHELVVGAFERVMSYNDDRGRQVMGEA